MTESTPGVHKLIDITFQIAVTMHMERKHFENMTRVEVAEWVARQLHACGFPTIPMGASWGGLVSEQRYQEHHAQIRADLLENEGAESLKPANWV